MNEPLPPPLPEFGDGKPSMRRVLFWVSAGLAVVAVTISATLCLVVAFRLGRSTGKPFPQRADTSVDPVERPRRAVETEAEKKRERDRLDRMFDVAYVTPHEISLAFADNGLAAEQEYRGRMVQITGRIAAVAKNKEGLPFVAFDGAGGRVVRVFIADNAVDDFATVRVGQPVIVLAAFGSENGILLDFAGGIKLDKPWNELEHDARTR